MKKVGLIGWRGMVGSVLMQRIEEESDYKDIESYFFSTSQAGQTCPKEYAKDSTLIDAFDINALLKMDILLSCQGSDYTKKILKPLRESGWNGHWIDAASELRMNDDAVIVLDPINYKSIEEAFDKGVKNWVGGNCTVSLMLLAIQGLVTNEVVEWVSSMTYQAASGAGAENMRELLQQMGQIHSSVEGKLNKKNINILDVDKEVQSTINSNNLSTNYFKVPLAGSLIPWIDDDLGDGQSREEWKGSTETNKILGPELKSINVDGICVRTGVMRSHSQALTIKLNKNLSLERVNDLISSGNSWVKLIPNVKDLSLKELSPAAVSGKLDIAVGRVKKLNLGDNYISIFTVGDQLLWGAAEPIRRMLKILVNK